MEHAETCCPRKARVRMLQHFSDHRAAVQVFPVLRAAALSIEIRMFAASPANFSPLQLASRTSPPCWHHFLVAMLPYSRVCDDVPGNPDNSSWHPYVNERDSLCNQACDAA